MPPASVDDEWPGNDPDADQSLSKLCSRHWWRARRGAANYDPARPMTFWLLVTRVVFLLVSSAMRVARLLCPLENSSFVGDNRRGLLSIQLLLCRRCDMIHQANPPTFAFQTDPNWQTLLCLRAQTKNRCVPMNPMEALNRHQGTSGKGPKMVQPSPQARSHTKPLRSEACAVP